MILATISAPVSYVTGVVVWKNKYRGYKTRIFTRKIQYSFIVAGLGFLCVLWYGFSPNIVSNPGSLRYVFLACNFALLPFTFYLGYLGGRLIFGGAH
jgi:hypothetical protein